MQVILIRNKMGDTKNVLMNETIQKDSLSILNGVTEAIKDSQISSDVLFEYSNRCTHNASIFQDQDTIRLAIVVYALYKIHKRFTKIPADLVKYLFSARQNIKDYRIEQYRSDISKIIDSISKVSSLQPYISQVLDDARIKKGAKLVDHGISVGQAADVLGVSQWEMQNYLGKTGFSEEMNVDDSTKRLLKRLSVMRSLFKL